MTAVSWSRRGKKVVPRVDQAAYGKQSLDPPRTILEEYEKIGVPKGQEEQTWGNKICGCLCPVLPCVNTYT